MHISNRARHVPFGRTVDRRSTGLSPGLAIAVTVHPLAPRPVRWVPPPVKAAHAVTVRSNRCPIHTKRRQQRAASRKENRQVTHTGRGLAPCSGDPASPLSPHAAAVTNRRPNPLAPQYPS